MTLHHKLSLTLAALGAALLLGGCGTQFEDARPAFGYSGLAAGDSTLSAYEQAKADFAAARYGLAVKRFQMAMAEDPASIEAVNGLAAAYDKIGRYDLSERFYRRALAMDPASVQTLNNLGYSLLLQGRHDLALAFLRDAARIDPDNAMIAANAERAVAARVEQRSRDLAEAAPTAQPAAPPAPDAAPRIVRMSPSEQRLELRPQPAVLPAVLTAPLAPPMPALPLEPVETRSLPEPAAPADPSDAQAAVAPVASRPSVYYITAATGGGAVVPAGPSESLAEAAALTVTIEVANGTGRRHMAARLRGYLAGLGLEVTRLVNADRFSYPTTTVTYRPGHRDLAEALSAHLPVAPRLRQVTEQPTDVRVRLGGDLLEFDRGLLQAERNASHADAL